MGRRAFSLVELLVVIAIIVILVAILFPVFARAKARAKQTTCMSNMHQIALKHQLEGTGPNLSCPLKEQYGVSYHALQDRRLVDVLDQVDHGHSYVVCYLHGEHVGSGNSSADFSGTILRLRPDGSVQVRNVERGCINGVPVRPDWRLFSDEPCPPEFCSPLIKPCH